MTKVIENMHLKKQAILQHIYDMKVNFNAMTLINRTLTEEKKQGFKFDFHERSLFEKKQGILDIIRREEESMDNNYPIYSDNIENNGIKSILLKPLLNESTGKLKITGKERSGEVRFLDGEIAYVLFKGIEGEKGFFELLNVTEGKTEFYLKDSIPQTRNIDKEVSALIKKTLLKPCPV